MGVALGQKYARYQNGGNRRRNRMPSTGVCAKTLPPENTLE
jgi:hypothetical protein